MHRPLEKKPIDEDQRRATNIPNGFLTGRAERTAPLMVVEFTQRLVLVLVE